MSANLLFGTSTPNLEEFLGNGNFFAIPDFQRDYAWSEDNWQELWNDSISAWTNKKPHFMGALVLQEQSEKEFKIIDGQQRTLTFSIFVISILNLLLNKGFEAQAELIRNSYVGKIDFNLNFRIKVRLNEKDGSFYFSHLATKIKEPISAKSLSKPKQRMWECYKFFYGELENYFVKNGEFDKDLLIDFFDTGLTRQLLFIRIDVKDELSAFTLFETLNGTGLKLTTADMIKNHLFSITSGVDDIFLQTKAKWQEITSNIEEDEFSDFLRYVWSGTRKKITKNELLKEVKNSLKNSANVIDLLEELETMSEIYSALSDQDSSVWDDEQRKYIYILSKLFKNKQYKILMLIAKIKLNNADFTKLLKNMVAFIFRYQEIANHSPNKLEPIYSKIAIDLYSKKINTYLEIKERLKESYVSDVKFRTDFENWEPKNNKITKYFLVSIENELTGGSRSIYENETLEHILPQEPNDYWTSFGIAKTIAQNIYKVGNLTLLEKSKNNKIGNLSFVEKKPHFENSSYKITRDIFLEEIWNQDAIIRRQKQFAKIAQNIWKID